MLLVGRGPSLSQREYNLIAANSTVWDVIKDLSDDTQLYGTCTTSSAKGCFMIKFVRFPVDGNLVIVSLRHLWPLAKDEDEPESAIN